MYICPVISSKCMYEARSKTYFVPHFQPTLAYPEPKQNVNGLKKLDIFLSNEICKFSLNDYARLSSNQYIVSFQLMLVFQMILKKFSMIIWKILIYVQS